MESSPLRHRVRGVATFGYLGGICLSLVLSNPQTIADGFILKNGEVIKGKPFHLNDLGVVFRDETGRITRRIPWSLLDEEEASKESEAIRNHFKKLQPGGRRSGESTLITQKPLTTVGSVPHDVLKAKAQRGDLEAQKKLGALYREGSDNIKIDLTEAIKWLRMAAEQGDVQSHNTLGAMYARRNAGHEDTNQAFHW